jgi:ATP-dependent HslUV protease subunit HslV
MTNLGREEGPTFGGQRLRATTVVAVVRDGCIAVAADGQVTLGETVMKQKAEKVRKVGKGRAVVGFAGGVADALTLLRTARGETRDASRKCPPCRGGISARLAH